MNHMISEQNPEREYRAAMQDAALCYMQRHQAEHLGNDQQLFVRTVAHLQTTLEVPIFLAENLTGLAYGQLRTGAGQRHLNLKSSTETVAVLSDPASGKSFAIPVALIFQHLVDASGARPKTPNN
ncbi:hypothetical protein [Pseudomonas sp. A214]|uniref:hypothetical protein n=1 Tax=Pseudomonas sp. A214 TaxID=1855331 RepID=UPI0009537362|nr:hypothetical protein [Pseudomonas sp. A214]SIR44087.1 hypothetical protein SAMN05216504_0983 [Pseudomonas sp. A214]